MRVWRAADLKEARSTSLMGVKDQPTEFRVLIRCIDCNKLARVRTFRTQAEADHAEANTRYRCGLCCSK